MATAGGSGSAATAGRTPSKRGSHAVVGAPTISSRCGPPPRGTATTHNFCRARRRSELSCVAGCLGLYKRSLPSSGCGLETPEVSFPVSLPRDLPGDLHSAKDIGLGILSVAGEPARQLRCVCRDERRGTCPVTKRAEPIAWHVGAAHVAQGSKRRLTAYSAALRARLGEVAIRPCADTKGYLRIAPRFQGPASHRRSDKAPPSTDGDIGDRDRYQTAETVHGGITRGDKRSPCADDKRRYRRRRADAP